MKHKFVGFVHKYNITNITEEFRNSWEILL